MSHEMLEVGGYFSTVLNVKKKNWVFQIFYLAYKMNHIKIYKDWSNLNTIKISFCKVAVPLIKFAIKDIKMTKKWLSYLYLASYNTREED